MKTLKPLLGLMILTLVAAVPSSADEVNIYSYRQAFLLEPIIESFTAETGIKVNVVFAKKGLAERLEREGKFSPADVVMTTDISRLIELVDKGLTQTVESEVIKASVPAQYRSGDNQWFALTLRARNLYTSKTLGDQSALTYESLADPKYKGQICTRSGKHPYNIALVASMIAHNGEAETKQWLEGVKENLARRPQGNDRAQVKAVKEGVCTIAIGNGYYYGKMLQNEEQRAWADAVNLIFPNQSGKGTHVNVSGMVMTRHTSNYENALKFMEFLVSDQAQEIYAAANMEYPVKSGVKNSDLVESWGKFEADDLSLDSIAKNRSAALKLMDEVKFDL